MKYADDDIVISGVGGFFPKANNIEEFTTRLLNNENLVGTKWDTIKNLDENVIPNLGSIPIQQFDNSFFGIHRNNANGMDPKHRSVLERTFEALIDAGINPSEIKGKQVACLIASSIGETEDAYIQPLPEGTGLTGQARTMLSNRISYWLDIKGSSHSIDSSWVGGLEALKKAFHLIKSNRVEAAIIGATNICTEPVFQKLFTDMGLLSKDGVTRAFDADANGYARSDGVVVLYIQRARDAKKQYAQVVNVSTLYNGDREGGLLDFDANFMSRYLTDFYKSCNVDPNSVDFVEAYGCGIPEIDRKELEALEKVFCSNRQRPLLVGSVKTNTGHTESSASLVSLVKALIAFKTGTIPANLHYKNPNPRIEPLTKGTIKVVDKNTNFSGEYIAVNAIGLSSTYGHVLLKRANLKQKTETGIELNERVPRLALLSTRTEQGIQEIIEKISEEDNEEYFQLIQDIFSTSITGYLYRGYMLKGSEKVSKEFGYYMGNKRPIWFVYSGMGSQWPGMCCDLMKIPVFKESIMKSNEIMKSNGIDLLHIITTTEKTIFDNILHSFVGIAAIQIALTDVLRTLGITPNGIIGHSVGELGCAYADGCMTAEQMILSAYYRGRASIETELIKGTMAAVGMGYNQIKNKLPPTIEVACHNGPNSCTLSGPSEDMEKFIPKLKAEGTFAKLVNVANIAYHSRYIKPAAPKLLQYLKKVLPEPKLRSSKWISTSNAEEKWGTDLAKYSSPDYHTNNLLSSVLFEEGLKHIPKDSILIEIAPHGLLQAILKRSVSEDCLNVAITQRDCKSGVEFLLTGLGKLYVAGIDMKLQNLYPRLPYPVSSGTPSLASLVKWEHSETWNYKLEEDAPVEFGLKETSINLHNNDYINHQIYDEVSLPCSSFLELLCGAMKTLGTYEEEIVFENLVFQRPAIVSRDVTIQASVQRGSGDFEIIADSVIIMTGKVVIPEVPEKFLHSSMNLHFQQELPGNDLYAEMLHRGYNYQGKYRPVKSIKVGEKGSLASIEWNNDWRFLLEAMIQQCLFHSGEKFQEIHLPKTIQKITISGNILKQIDANNKIITSKYHYGVGIISAEGIQIKGITTAPFRRIEKPITCQSVEFVSLENAKFSNMEQCINLALNIATHNFTEKIRTGVVITEIASKNGSLSSNLKNVLDQYRYLPVPIQVNTVNDAKSIGSNTNPVLLVTNDVITEDMISQVTAPASDMVLLARSDSVNRYQEVIEAARSTVDGVSYSIVKKVNSYEHCVVKIDSETISSEDISSSSQWVSELKNSISKTEQRRVHLIIPTIPAEGIYNFMEVFRGQNQFASVRVDFILNKNVSRLDFEDPFYQNLFKADLPLTVTREKTTETILPVPIVIKDDVKKTSNVRNKTGNDTKLTYLGLNLVDETFLPSGKKNNELGNIDYSGISTTGQRIMGLAKYDPNNSKLIPDDVFQWNIADSWSDADGATIPHAYASAYYALFIKGKIEPNNSVLIHAGCAAVGLSAITIALARGCTVFTTVATELQRAFVKKHTYLNDRNIFSSKTDHFHPLIMSATRGEGVQVVLNCLSGSLLNASVSCLSANGRLIHTGRYDLQGQCSINMSVFLRNTMFSVVNFNEMFTLEKETKEQIRDLVQEGMKQFAVIPLHYRIADNYEVESIIQTLENPGHIGKVLIEASKVELNRINLKDPRKIVCQEESSYVVYGGNPETSSDLVEWLIKRGAKKVLLFDKINTQQTYIKRRFSLLVKHFNVHIKLSTRIAHTKEEAMALLSEATSLGPIQTVFLLEGETSNHDEAKITQSIDAALRTTAPNAFLVNFQPNVAALCLERAEARFPTYNIKGTELSFRERLHALDEILRVSCSDIVARKNYIEESDKESVQSLLHKLSLMLPSSLKEYSNHIKMAPKKLKFHQIATQGPQHARQMAPLFIIPGLTGENEIIELSKQLIYPAYVAELPSSSISIKEIANELVTQMIKIWGRPPYNLLAVSWGGALATEIARILEGRSLKVAVYLIDAALSTLKGSLRHLGETSTELEVNILGRILEINDSEILSDLASESSWTGKLERAASYCPSQTDKLAMDVLRSRLVELYNYPVPTRPILGDIHLIRPTGSSKYDDCNLTSFYEQSPAIEIVKGDHISIVKNEETANYINKTMRSN